MAHADVLRVACRNTRKETKRAAITFGLPIMSSRRGNSPRDLNVTTGEEMASKVLLPSTKARELAVTQPDEHLLSVTYAERDELPDIWPQRLLFVPEMKSYERAEGNRYGSTCEPCYNILSYT